MIPIHVKVTPKRFQSDSKIHVTIFPDCLVPFFSFFPSFALSRLSSVTLPFFHPALFIRSFLPSFLVSLFPSLPLSPFPSFTLALLLRPSFRYFRIPIFILSFLPYFGHKYRSRASESIYKSKMARPPSLKASKPRSASAGFAKR